MASACEVKLYLEYKSPFAYLARARAFELAHRYEVEQGLGV
jgi:2-hydroxychromene-2-carboxylate isomerase